MDNGIDHERMHEQSLLHWAVLIYYGGYDGVCSRVKAIHWPRGRAPLAALARRPHPARALAA